jgi:hypothetical protein
MYVHAKLASLFAVQSIGLCHVPYVMGGPGGKSMIIAFQMQ